MHRIPNFQKSLLNWYEKNGRHDLPWRHTKSPYEILVSEIMLQQTQVETVLNRFYQPFLKRFPTLSSLADASSQSIMEQWQGLGYYRRAKNLQQTAKLSVPGLPSNFDELIKLPGVGKNTAHAVLAFAYHKPYPVMEANVRRVLCRIFALKAPTEKELWEKAFCLLDRQNPFDYNQAIMDLGSLVCTPKSPTCHVCPAQAMCLGNKAPDSFPAPKKKKTAPIKKQQILVIKDTAGRIYAKARDGDFLYGLFQFVELEEEESAIILNGQQHPKQSWKRIGSVTQTYSHFKQYAEVCTLLYHGSHKKSHWYGADELRALPLSGKEQKVLKLLGI